MQATQPAGYSADTEILTRHGWVTFPHLTYMSEVATRSPDGRFEWQYPERIICQQYDGPMVAFRSRTTDLLATPGTPVLHMERQRIRRDGVLRELDPVERVRMARDLVGQRWPLVATSRWEPENPRREITLTPTRKQTYGGRLARKGHGFSTTADDFAAFMGMYLSEGSLGPVDRSGYSVWIWQTAKGNGFRAYQNLLNHIWGREIPWLAKKGSWHLTNKALYEYLKPCGGYAWTKRIPDGILDLPAIHLERFWEFYALGDGTIMNSGTNRKPLGVISTTSRQMAGQMQEILQKLGGWALIQCIDPGKYAARVNGRTIKDKHLTYRLVRRAGTVAFATHIERVPYCGTIGNVEAGGRAIYVRRNWRPVWAGSAI